jgi:hypothetical protein
LEDRALTVAPSIPCNAPLRFHGQEPLRALICSITFVRTRDGLLLLLDSTKWKLERGKAYEVTLLAGSRSVQTKALAETKSVTIALSDRPLNERMRSANILEVKGEGATLRVALDRSAAALGRMETCFERNSRAGIESNPFVAPNRRPRFPADRAKSANRTMARPVNFRAKRQPCLAPEAHRMISLISEA